MLKVLLSISPAPDSGHSNTVVLDVFSTGPNTVFWEVLLALFTQNIRVIDPCKTFRLHKANKLYIQCSLVLQHPVLSETEMFLCFSSDKFVRCTAMRQQTQTLLSFAPTRLSVLSTTYLIKPKQTSQTPARLRKNKNVSKGGAILSTTIISRSITFQQLRFGISLTVHQACRILFTSAKSRISHIQQILFSFSKWNLCNNLIKGFLLFRQPDWVRGLQGSQAQAG